MTDSETWCSKHTEWGQCQQEPVADGLCGYHWHQKQGVQHTDRYYERKVVLGLVEPTDHFLTATEIETLFNGRARHDGRRLDAYTK